jgi:hypothetical protein
MHWRVALQAGRAHALRMEFYEQSGVATARLFWSSAHRTRQVVPPERLRPSLPATRP